MADISKITTPDGTSLDIKDDACRLMIAPEWNNTTIYLKNSIVTYQGNLYFSNAGGSGGNPPPENNVSWTKATTAFAVRRTNELRDVIASLYSNSSSISYAVGSYCIKDTNYDLSLYRCKEATTGGNWDRSKWDLISNIGEEITSLQTDVNTRNKSIWGGSIDSGSSASMKDFNNLLAPRNGQDYIRCYWVNLSVMSNSPATSGYGYLECIASLQRFTMYNTKIVYQRSYVNSTWSAWYRTSVDVGRSISSSDNLNNFTNNGTYWLGGVSPSNAPYSSIWGIMDVYNYGGTMLQRITVVGTGGIALMGKYVRFYINSAWQAWQMDSPYYEEANGQSQCVSTKNCDAINYIKCIRIGKQVTCNFHLSNSTEKTGELAWVALKSQFRPAQTLYFDVNIGGNSTAYTNESAHRMYLYTDGTLKMWIDNTNAKVSQVFGAINYCLF